MLRLAVLLFVLLTTACDQQPSTSASNTSPNTAAQTAPPAADHIQQHTEPQDSAPHSQAVPQAVVQASVNACGRDTDCKGERICEAGACVNPPPAATAPQMQAASDALEQAPPQTVQQAQPATEAAPAVVIDELQQQLISAMSWNSAIEGRVGDAGAAIRAYVSAGYLDLKPATRMDYSDYRRFKKPAQFLGHELLAIDEEYISAYIGCCASPGIAILIRLNPQGYNVGEFVQGRGCSLNSDVSRYSEIPELNLPYLSPKEVLEISCKERDTVSY